jgi:excisionase family DNA binding protein
LRRSRRWTRPSTIEVKIPTEVIETLAEAVANRIAERSLSEPERWIGVEEAASHLACPKSRIYDLVSARRIPHERDGSRLLFRRSDLDQWVTTGGGKRR